MEIGEYHQLICKGSNSYIKIKPDLVYDIPFIKSIQQQLNEKHTV